MAISFGTTVPIFTPNNGRESLATIPWQDVTEIGLSAFGAPHVANSTTRFITRGLEASNYRGAGLVSPSDGSIFDCRSHDNYIGAKLLTSDAEISRCRLYNNRDTCLWIANGSGNCQSLNNHCYGSRIACYKEGGGFCRFLQDTYADSFIGYLAYGWQDTLTNILSQHNTVRDILLLGNTQSMVNCVVNVQKAVNEHTGLDISGVITRSCVPYASGFRKVGVEVGDVCSIRGGLINLVDWVHPNHTASGQPSECVWINDAATGVVVDTALVDGQGINGAVGVRVKGSVKSCKIDITTQGFAGALSKLLVVDNASSCDGLDVTLRITDNTSGKTLADYVDIGTGWTGVPIKMIDAFNGTYTELAVGSAA